MPAKKINEITVGPKNADITGSDGRAIQLAIDALSVRGGGTVRILPGKYAVNNSIFLKSNIRLAGSGKKTILKKTVPVLSRLKVDADYGQKEITPESTRGFSEGMGLFLKDNSIVTNMVRLPLTVTKIAGGKLYIDNFLANDFCAENGGFVVTYFWLLYAEALENTSVEDLVVDMGEEAKEFEELKGLRIAAVYFTKSKNCLIKNIKVVHSLGDGICVSTCEHITVEKCETAYNTMYGIHFGGHSPWSQGLGNIIHHNYSDGLYICWGVRESVMSGNKIFFNGVEQYRNGISIGHKDTDNVFENNHIYGNAKHGVAFRHKTEANGAHRNIFRNNLIENNGTPEEKIPQEFLAALPRRELISCGVYINGSTHDLVFENNIIRETRKKGKKYQRNAFYLAPGVARVTLVKNRISGHPDAAIVDDSGKTK